ncbi:MAG: hypothetical protein ACN6OD_06015, partial [Alcaligenes sp.]
MANSILSDKFSNYYSTHQISESRLERLKDPDKAKATHLGLWDKFKDLFLTNKKQDALNALHDAIHGSSATGKLEAFETLKSCAGQAYQDRFTKQIDDNGIISLLIDEDFVTTCSVKEALYINENVTLLPMTTDEKGLFMRILDVVKEKEQSIKDVGNMIDLRRNAVRQEIQDDFYAVYRPAEQPTCSPVEWKGSEFEGSTDELKCLNSGTFDAFTQFNKIGYQYNPVMEDTEFRMVHPSISYLLGIYTNADEMGEMAQGDFMNKEMVMGQNAMFLEVINKDYSLYQENKSAIDNELKKIYELHGKTLCIEHKGGCRNYL